MTLDEVMGIFSDERYSVGGAARTRAASRIRDAIEAYGVDQWNGGATAERQACLQAAADHDYPEEIIAAIRARSQP